ncbi:aldehyde dehydrogenase (NAD+) [Cladophialophora psammophila CBS 110553]|uniref:aldehyde dehydrogenase (NAD(+)) n=1 Tax=Cladophialophora psammophila CBS 110553 TaxID=1182543 RepID=W9X5B1_9EURO|nr:aldehyde dehydrogenase (NAD+) [Cladophialophora psammophila CBS 110553]EXJ72505.1 aldehyde dehydrogenase (NAD+) [Cladophialophora psammophila CBS 110553]
MNGKKYDIINPATEKLSAIIYAADAEDVAIAVKAAKLAFPAWTESGALARVGYLFKLADALDKHADELDYLHVICMGKPIGNSSSSKRAKVPPIDHLYQEINLPKGMLNILSRIGQPYYEALAKYMDIPKLSFTGSQPTGCAINKAAADSNLKKVTLELGGKSPLIIFPDADLA